MASPRNSAAEKRAQKKFDFERATQSLLSALFEMRRMDFDLISILVFSAGGTKDYQPSLRKMAMLKHQAERVLKSISDAETQLKLYLEP